MSAKSQNNESLLHEFELLKNRVAELEETERENRKKIRALNEREETFMDIFCVAPAGLGMLKDRVFVKVNPLVLEITGYTRDELVGKNSRILYANNQDYENTGYELYTQIEKNGICSIETVWKRKDGTLIDVQISTTPINGKNLLDGVIFTALDITSEKKAKLALQSSEERLKVIYEHAADAIFLSDFNGVIIDGNHAGKKLLGSGKEELIGKSFLEIDFLAAESVEKASEILKQNEKGLISGSDKLRIETKNGEKGIVELSTYPVTINKKQIVLGVARDITQKLQEESFRRASEQRMALHVTQTPLAVIEWDLNFKVSSWNPAAERIFGYTEQEAIGQHASFIIPENTMQHVDQIWMELTMLNGGGKSSNVNRHKNGDTLACEWFNTPLVNDEGKVVAVASLGLDVTERMHSEEIQKVVYNISNAANTSDNLNKLIRQIKEELSTIIDTKNFFIALYDKANDSLSLPFFADEQDRFSSFPVGKTLTGYVIKNQKPLLATKDVMADLEERGEVESVGSDCEIWLGVPLVIDNEVIGALVVQSYHDPNAYNKADMKMLKFVSDQISLSIYKKKSELELLNALKRATEADQLKSAFLANMSHEIRTPMNGIMGFANLLKNEELSSKERNKYISIIEKSGTRMLGIINDLIDISKIESGMTEMHTTDFSLNNSLEYVDSFFKPEAALKGLELTYFTGLENEVSFIKSDREKVYAILINLVKNAIKYTNVGKIEFGYSIHKNVIRFKVHDSGIGIADNKLESIFNRFIQADLRLSSSYEGVGLGLAISKAYVEFLGGKIWVESEYLKGSTFYFEIPYLKGEKMNKTKETENKAVSNKPKKKLNILVAEDDLINQKLFSYILKEISNDLIITTNGSEAVNAFKQRTDFDLILMDLKMPEMDGYEATRIIRESDEDIKIIALSAFALETERKKALKNGFNNYVSKPISRAELLKAIGKYFEI